jgi:hypothetical protein
MILLRCKGGVLKNLNRPRQPALSKTNSVNSPPQYSLINFRQKKIARFDFWVLERFPSAPENEKINLRRPGYPHPGGSILSSQEIQRSSFRIDHYPAVVENKCLSSAERIQPILHEPSLGKESDLAESSNDPGRGS